MYSAKVSFKNESIGKVILASGKQVLRKYATQRSTLKIYLRKYRNEKEKRKLVCFMRYQWNSLVAQ